MEEKFITRWNGPHALGALDRKHIATKNPRNEAVTITTRRASFPGPASPGRHRIQIPLDRLWVKQIITGCTYF